MRKHNLKRTVLVALAAVLLSQPLIAGKKQETKVRSARWVYEELFGNKQQRIPVALLADTRCLAVFPGLVKAAFAFGGSHGTGVVSCRNAEGSWSPPSFVKMSEGSFGLQLGYKATDLVLFFVTEEATKTLLDKKTAFGGGLSVAGGPTGRQAGTTTDRDLSNDIYIYAQARGLFAGASVEGLRLGASPKAIRKFYGHYVWPGEILFEHKVPMWPPEAEEFKAGLDKLPWE